MFYSFSAKFYKELLFDHESCALILELLELLIEIACEVSRSILIISRFSAYGWGGFCSLLDRPMR